MEGEREPIPVPVDVPQEPEAPELVGLPQVSEPVDLAHDPAVDIPLIPDTVAALPVFGIGFGANSAAERAAVAGLLREVCKHVSFTELKRLRQVCKAWYDVINPLPRMANCTGKLGNEWSKEASGMDYERCIKFRSVYFRFFQFKRNPIFKPYWNFIQGNNVTRLKFKFAKMPCNEMVTFLQECPHLQEVYFNQCNFNLVIYQTEQRGQRGPHNLRTCCTHVNGLADLNLPGGQVIPPMIHTVRFKSQNVFPLCVMDLLIQRSQGVLHTFQFSEALFPRWKRNRFLPTKAIMEARFLTWIATNRETITYFNWFKVHRGDELLTTLRTNNVVLPNVLDVLIGQKSSWDNMDTYRPFFDFLRLSCGPNLRSAHVRMIHRFATQDMFTALANKPEIRNLKLDGIWCAVQNQLQVIPLLRNFPHLESLELWDRNRRNVPCFTNDYVPNLPDTLKKLSFFSYFMDIEHVANFIESANARRLKSLYIESGRLLTNAMMQTIIEGLPQLEELGISNSRFLTDAGLIGLTDKAVETIVNCKSGILYRCKLQESAIIGKNICELKNLTKLGFCMSRHVSDISIYLGFKFPKIREINLSWCLNVTDVGLYWLAKNNPGLERVVLMKNRKITHFGLNELVTQCQTIKNVHTSRSCRDRKMGKQLNYVEHPRFNKIVSYAKWVDKRPGQYGDD